MSVPAMVASVARIATKANHPILSNELKRATSFARCKALIRAAVALNMSHQGTKRPLAPSVLRRGQRA
jgi:hypothetical protein